MAKVRYLSQGFRYKYKPYMLHDVSTLRISSIGILLSVFSTLGFRDFSHDVTQAYLQSKYKLTRIIYIKPKPQGRVILGLRDGDIFELVRPLYGLCDSGDYWVETM